MNGMPKYVVSSTLRDPDWNNSTVIGLDRVAALKDEVEGDLLVDGQRPAGSRPGPSEVSSTNIA